MVIELQARDAQPRVVLNQLYKHTQLQTTFGANLLALAERCPRTLHPARSRPGLRRPPIEVDHAPHGATI